MKLIDPVNRAKRLAERTGKGKERRERASELSIDFVPSDQLFFARRSTC